MIVDIKDHSSTPVLKCFKKMHKTHRPVSEEWQKYSVFKKWYNSQPEGSFVLIQGSIYNPTNCATVPRSLMWVFQEPKKSKSGLPTGVYEQSGRFVAAMSNKYIGTFNTKEEAHLAYAKVRKKKITDAVTGQPVKIRDAALAIARSMVDSAAHKYKLVQDTTTVEDHFDTNPVVTPEEDMDMVDSYTDMVSVAVRKGYKFELSFDEYRTAMLSASSGREHDMRLAYKYQQKRSSTKDLGIEFKLGFDKYRELMAATHCAYTGVPFVVNLTDHPRTRTLERINSGIGYTNDNTIAVTLEANWLKNAIVDTPKGTMDAGSFRKLADTILANQELVDIMDIRTVNDKPAPPEPVTAGDQRKTFADWRRAGRTVIKGEKKTGKTAEGVATFSINQTCVLDR